MRHILLLVLFLVLTASDAFAATGDPVEAPRAPWTDAAVDTFALLPVQDGVVITSIAGRNDYRGYAKPVKTGKCDLAMSEEEKQVLEMANTSLAARGVEAPRPAAAAPEPRKKATAAV